MSYEYELPPGYETRMKVVKALHELMRQKTYQHITINEICKQSDLSRQTFYRYFNDKLDIANWYWSIRAAKTLGQIGRTLTWHEGRLCLAEFCEKERDFLVAALLKNEEYNALGNYSIRFVEEGYRRTITEINHKELTPLLDFQLRFWVYGASLFTRKWIIDGADTPAAEFTAYLDTCLPEELRHLMDDPVLERRDATKTHHDPPAHSAT
ncbi:MAG: TetR/AcrR family transcriptional regulator [Coriobacteriia bacterium]